MNYVGSLCTYNAVLKHMFCVIYHVLNINLKMKTLNKHILRLGSKNQACLCVHERACLRVCSCMESITFFPHN